MMKCSLSCLTMVSSVVLLWATLGCSPGPDFRDQRLAEFAARSTTEQAQQNARMAEIVRADAEARKEMMATHQTLTSQLNQQQAVIDAGRDQLEEERRNLAQQRHRDPIIAAALQSTGVLLACLLPLLLAAYALKQMRQEEPDQAAVAELLVYELTSERPLFLPAPIAPRLGSSTSASDPPPWNDDELSASDFPY